MATSNNTTPASDAALLDLIRQAQEAWTEAYNPERDPPAVLDREFYPRYHQIRTTAAKTLAGALAKVKFFHWYAQRPGAEISDEGMEAAVVDIEAVCGSPVSSATPGRSPTIIDLADALGPISWMAEIADQLVELVTENILSHRQIAGGNFGPVDGLNWIAHTLVAATAEAKAMAEALAEGEAA